MNPRFKTPPSSRRTFLGGFVSDGLYCDLYYHRGGGHIASYERVEAWSSPHNYGQDNLHHYVRTPYMDEAVRRATRLGLIDKSVADALL